MDKLCATHDWLDEPLTYAEACAALKLTVSNVCGSRSVFNANFLKPLEKRKALSPGARALLAEIRGGWDMVGKRIFDKDKPGIQGFAYDDRCVLTLRFDAACVCELSYASPRRIFIFEFISSFHDVGKLKLSLFSDSGILPLC